MQGSFFPFTEFQVQTGWRKKIFPDKVSKAEGSFAHPQGIAGQAVPVQLPINGQRQLLGIFE